MPIIGIILVIVLIVFLYNRYFSHKGGLPGFNSDSDEKQHYSIDHRYNKEKHAQQKEIDRILEKIHRKGIESLSREEREKLDRYSKRS